MNPVERLKRDHRLLRSKLALIESALRMGSEAWYVLRELCFTLGRQLQHHMDHEEDLVLGCLRARNPAMLAEMACEHRDEPERLRSINRLFMSEPNQRLDEIAPKLSEVARRLRRHMTEEETILFPVLERELSAHREDKARWHEPSGAHVAPCMSINAIMHLYPATRSVFERLHISPAYEGLDCLDEVAWRRGADLRALIDELERAIASEITPAAPAAERSLETCEYV